MSASETVVQVAQAGIDPDLWRHLADQGHSHADVTSRIAEALKKKFDDSTAYDIAFHCSDWIGDAIGLVALHLRPELFDDEEVESIVEGMAIHACAHVMALTKLQGWPLNDTWNLDLEIEAHTE